MSNKHNYITQIKGVMFTASIQQVKPRLMLQQI